MMTTNRTKLLAVLVATGLISVSSCGPSNTIQTATTRVLDEDVAAFVAAQVDLGAAVNSCNGQALSVDDVSVVLIPISRRLCLGCEDLGWFVRRMSRSTNTISPILVTTNTDAEFACDYLARENARTAVLGVDAKPAPEWWHSLDRLVVVEVDRAGHVHRYVSATDGLEAWSLWNGDKTDGPSVLGASGASEPTPNPPKEVDR